MWHVKTYDSTAREWKTRGQFTYYSHALEVRGLWVLSGYRVTVDYKPM